VTRCFGDGEELYEAYHDREWGRPVVDERGLYERVCLEALQSGLSWLVVLRKRERLRAVFFDFAPERVASLSENDLESFLGDPGIIRNRAKLRACVANARATLRLRDSETPLPRLVWSFRPEARHAPAAATDVPASTPEARALCDVLRGAGFRFVGPTTTYALMQACGVVNDHLVGCPVRAEVEAEQLGARPQ
jgi:DNA-3-methyladenine glycosylase I